MRSLRLLAAISLSALWATGALAFSEQILKVRIGDNQKVFPESITTTENGVLFAGSIGVGSVFRANSGAGIATAWTEPPTEGPAAITGVLADEKAGLLWVCYADMAAMSGGDAKPSIVRTFALADASLKGTYPLPEKSFCNDIAIAADGTAYVTDTSGARVLRLKPGATDLETWKSDPALLAGIDGVAMAPDGTLYVNNVMTGKIYRLAIGADGAAGDLTEIATPAALQGPDGMRFGADGRLYVAENQARQVDVLTISGESATVKTVKRGYDSPTAVSITAPSVYIGEAKFSKMGGTGDPGQFYVYLVPIPKP